MMQRDHGPRGARSWLTDIELNLPVVEHLRGDADAAADDEQNAGVEAWRQTTFVLQPLNQAGIDGADGGSTRWLDQYSVIICT